MKNKSYILLLSLFLSMFIPFAIAQNATQPSVTQPVVSPGTAVQIKKVEKEAICFVSCLDSKKPGNNSNLLFKLKLKPDVNGFGFNCSQDKAKKNECNINNPGRRYIVTRATLLCQSSSFEFNGVDCIPADPLKQGVTGEDPAGAGKKEAIQPIGAANVCNNEKLICPIGYARSSRSSFECYKKCPPGYSMAADGTCFIDGCPDNYLNSIDYTSTGKSKICAQKKECNTKDFYKIGTKPSYEPLCYRESFPIAEDPDGLMAFNPHACDPTKNASDKLDENKIVVKTKETATASTFCLDPCPSGFKRTENKICLKVCPLGWTSLDSMNACYKNEYMYANCGTDRNSNSLCLKYQVSNQDFLIATCPIYFDFITEKANVSVSTNDNQTNGIYSIEKIYLYDDLDNAKKSYYAQYNCTSENGEVLVAGKLIVLKKTDTNEYLVVNNNKLNLSKDINAVRPICLMPDGRLWGYDANLTAISGSSVANIININTSNQEQYDTPKIIK